MIHVEEALRLAKHEDEGHLRLALMLFDSAAELIMHRAVQTNVALQHFSAQVLASYDRAEEQGFELSDGAKKSQAELRSKVLSKSKLRDLDRNFDAKAQYLGDLGDLPVAEVRVLRKLHAYRNEAYHRDKLRPATLRSAVNIYSYLVGTMMRDLRMFGSISMEIPPALTRYLASIHRWAGGGRPDRVRGLTLGWGRG